MKCPRCQHENRSAAKFCEECATPFARACSRCGTELAPTAKFCPECAHPTGTAVAAPAEARFGTPQSYTPRHLAEKILTSKSALEGERKQVTVLAVNLMGDWLRDHLDPKLRQLGGRAMVLETPDAVAVGPAIADISARSTAGDGG